MWPVSMYPAAAESNMTEVVNLRSIRKRIVRLQDEQRAVERRILFGMPKGERRVVKARAEKARHDLEGHRIEDGEGR